MSGLLARRRVRFLLGLVVALAVVRGVLGWFRPAYEPAAPLLSFDPEQVARVVLARGERELVLTREEQGWVVSQPGPLPARAGVDDLLRRLASWREERQVHTDPSRHEEAQLTDELARRVSLQDSAGQELAALLIGRISRIEPEDVREHGYALDTEALGLQVRRPHEATVYEVTDFVTGELEPEPTRWYLRPLVSFAPEQVQSLELSRGEAAATIDVRQARVAGDPRPLDPNRVGGVLLGLRQIEAQGPAPGATPPASATRLVLRRAGQPPLEVALWREGDRRLLACGDLRVEATAFPFDRLQALELSELVRRRVLLVDPARVQELRYRDEVGQLQLTREPGGQWRQGELDPDRNSCQEILTAIADLAVLEWSPLEPGEPIARVFVTAYGREVELELGAEWVRSEGLQAKVAAEQVAALRRAWHRLREPLREE